MKKRMFQQLARRRKEGTLRTLRTVEELEAYEKRPNVDFSSNDYLGLAHSAHQRDKVKNLNTEWERKKASHHLLGATGSRLLSGDSLECRRLEQYLAKVHHSEGALIFNSGYDANLSILSSVPMEGDVVIMDELAHNSLVMGVRMSRLDPSNSLHLFRHNNVESLRSVLKQFSSSQLHRILVVVESVYSMDGDVSPLADILDLALEFGAEVMVDEAHGLGVYGRTNKTDMTLPEHQKASLDNPSTSMVGGTGVLAALGLETHPALLCSVFTFGKAAGCHGAVVCGARVLLDYLINYARPLIYSTALPVHSLLCIQCAYETMLANGDPLRANVFGLVKTFRREIMKILQRTGPSEGSGQTVLLWPSPSPIQALVVRGNDNCMEFCRRIRTRSDIILYPIRSPTVPKGEERIRIVLHAHNTEEEVLELVKLIHETLSDMNLIKLNSRL